VDYTIMTEAKLNERDSVMLLSVYVGGLEVKRGAL